MNHIGNEPVVLTHKGHYVSLVSPDPATIDVEDIAYALSHICRYTGHTDRFYSVAEHSIRCMWFLRRRGYSPMAQLAALMHDATEAYLGDVSSPLKSLLPEYRMLEARMEHAIATKFNINFGRPEVKMADLQLLCSERHALLKADRTPWRIIDGLDPDDAVVGNPLQLSPEKTREVFLQWVDKLEAEIAHLTAKGC